LGIEEVRVRNIKWSVAVVALGFGSLVAAPAAAEPVTANSIQLGLGLRYGLEMNDGDLNPWGLGLGVQGGYTLPNAIYAGGVFEYFFGDSQEVAGVKVKANLWQLMAEGGYDLGLGPTFVLRPKVGAGLANLRGETCLDGCVSDSESDLAIAPGATFLLFLPGFRLSADVRYDLVFAEKTQKALILTAGFGF
jgi:hypothetical protein